MSATIDNLLQSLQKKKLRDGDVRSTGCQKLDAILPFAGIREGSIVEWIGTESFVEAAFCSLLVTRTLLKDSQPWLVIDPTNQLYPPAIHSLGISIEQLIYVSKNDRRDQQWVCEQALRCSGLGLVWAVQPSGNMTTFRRFQVAAEQSGTIGMFVFDSRRKAHRCWGDARLQVKTLPSLAESPRFRIEVLRSVRGNFNRPLVVSVDAAGDFYVESDDETDRLSMVSELADPAISAG